jgi:hypothetical protein
MQLTVRLVTRSRPGTWTRVIVLVIIIVAVLLSLGIGYGPATAITVIVGAGLSGAQVARALCAGNSPDA